MLFKVGVGPAVCVYLRLFELDGAAGVDSCEDAEAKVDGMQDFGFDACDAMGVLVDPDAPRHAGECFGEHGGRVEGGVGLEVKDNLRGGGVSGLRLSGGEGVQHGLGKKRDEFKRLIAHVFGAFTMPSNFVGMNEIGLETIALSVVFGCGEGLSIAAKQAGDVALFAFDDFARGVAAGVDLVLEIAQGKIALRANDRELVLRGCGDPGCGRAWKLQRLSGDGLLR